jgi:hypothetical protein
MRLEPVFLVAPRDRAAAVTRRSFLFAGATFACGASLGGVCTALAARAVALPDDALAPTGDAELDQLRRLALEGSDDQIVQRRLLLVASTFSHYGRDPVLWHGIGRLCDLVVADAAFPDRARFARALVGVIERADAPFANSLQQRAAALRGAR